MIEIKKIILLGLVMILLSSFVFATTVSDLNDGAIVYYTLGENALNYVDSTGNLSLTVGTIPTRVVGVINFGQDFEATSAEYLATANNDLLATVETNNPFVCAWYKPEATNTNQIIASTFYDDGGNYKGWILRHLNTNVFAWDVFGNGGNYDRWQSALNPVAGTWYHICGSFVGGETEMFINGVSNGAETQEGTAICDWSAGNQNLRVGKDGVSYADGVMDEIFYGNLPATADHASFLYNGGAPTSDQQYLFGAVAIFELNLTNFYDSSPIINFTAQISNGTYTENKTSNSTDGSVQWNTSEIVNITIFNITGTEGVYFNRTYYDVDTNTSLTGEVWQSVLILDAQENISGFEINVFNATVFGSNSSQFNTSNASGLTTFYVNAAGYNVSGKAQGYRFNTTGNITAVNLQIVNLSLSFNPNIINVTAINKNTSSIIDTFNVSINNGQFINITTTSSANVSCPSISCNITIVAENFFSETILNHDSLDNVQFNMTNTTNVIRFLNANTGLGIDNTTITITYPSLNTRDFATNSSGSILFNSTYAGANEIGTYQITFTQEGFSSPITISEVINKTTAPLIKNYSMSVANLIINIYDRETYVALTREVQLTVLKHLNTTTNNGTYYFSNLTSVNATITIVAISDGYFTEERTIAFTNRANMTVNFYMLNATGSNTGNHFVSTLDEFYITQPDTHVELLEYSVADLAFIKVSEGYTDTNGECFFGVELNIKKYIIRGSRTIGGQVYTDSTSSNGIFFQVDNGVTQLFLKLTTQFTTTTFSQLNYAIQHNFRDIYNDVTNRTNINVSFLTEDGTDTTICLDYYEIDGDDWNLTAQTCSVTSSGLIQSERDLDRTKLNKVQIYQLVEGYMVLILDRNVQSVTSFESILDNEELLSPLVLLPFLAILVFSLWTRKIMFFVIGAPVIAWVEVVLFPSIVFGSVAVLITFVCLILLKVSLKQRTEIS